MLLVHNLQLYYRASSANYERDYTNQRRSPNTSKSHQETRNMCEVKLHHCKCEHRRHRQSNRRGEYRIFYLEIYPDEESRRLHKSEGPHRYASSRECPNLTDGFAFERRRSHWEYSRAPMCKQACLVCAHIAVCASCCDLGIEGMVQQIQDQTWPCVGWVEKHMREKDLKHFILEDPHISFWNPCPGHMTASAQDKYFDSDEEVLESEQYKEVLEPELYEDYWFMDV